MKLLPVLNHDGYFVNESGEVFSDKAKGGKLRKLKLSRRGRRNKHYRVMFSGDRKNYYVHRVVFEAFHGPIPNDKIICHKNDIATDNRISNLYLGTHKDNHNDAKVNGTKPIGEKCTFSKLKEKDVMEIIDLEGELRVKDIANIFNVSKSTIVDIYKKRTWKHIKRERLQ